VRNPSAAKIRASAFRLKSKKTKRQLKKLPRKNVLFPLNRTVARFGRAKIKAQIENQARRGERDFAQTAFTPFQKATGIKQSKVRRSAQRHSRSGRGR
jgi:hypothetical protein